MIYRKQLLDGINFSLIKDPQDGWGFKEDIMTKMTEGKLKKLIVNRLKRSAAHVRTLHVNSWNYDIR
jgi:hypothetical protein